MTKPVVCVQCVKKGFMVGHVASLVMQIVKVDAKNLMEIVTMAAS